MFSSLAFGAHSSLQPSANLSAGSDMWSELMVIKRKVQRREVQQSAWEQWERPKVKGAKKR